MDSLIDPSDTESVDLGNDLDVVEQLEDVALDFLTQLCRSGMKAQRDASDADSSASEDTKPSNSKAKLNIRIPLADRTKPNDSATHGLKYLTYPRKLASGSARPIAQLFKVINLMHEAIHNDVPATKRRVLIYLSELQSHYHRRDIYYKDVQLFKTQKVVDTLVDDIAATLQVDRSNLNVRATSKGTFCGSGLTIHLLTGEMIRGNDAEATLIPVGEDIESFDFDNEVKWVLIVEKDAVFQTLCHLKLTNHPRLSSRGLMITGKGYPDIATRHLVKTFVPILALVDSDPYGIDILSVYRFGSRALHHERERLAAERVEWLGVWPSELTRYGIEKDDLIPITEHDRKKMDKSRDYQAFSLLQRPRSQMPTKWRKELIHMLHNRRKAEIEILCSRNLPSSQSNAEDDVDVDVDVPDDSPATSNSFKLPANTPMACGSSSTHSRSPLLQYLIDKLLHTAMVPPIG
ncbi:hypothetical protein D9758_006787 [Tetrapyrgos nigripes]|uniref:DNA topoisomerase (ATP-hydrolyzing) n=1 Tax=Tetrapyrgos nigripes TaxID=182062 RepID=A0A8H5FTZ8_9AGAR|nr:hypothetical protein D9758_006787 [Tetrapyrgos nigripes]